MIGYFFLWKTASALTAPGTKNFSKNITSSIFLSQITCFCNCKSSVYTFSTASLQRGFMNMLSLTAAQSY